MSKSTGSVSVVKTFGRETEDVQNLLTDVQVDIAKVELGNIIFA